MKQTVVIIICAVFFSCNEKKSEVAEEIKTTSPSAEVAPVQKAEASASSPISYASTDHAYTIIETAFEGYPDKKDVKPMLEDVMKRYGMEITDDGVLKAANVLVAMKNASLVGVTEIEILKRVYQRGAMSGDYVTNIAIAATFLESTK